MSMERVLILERIDLALEGNIRTEKKEGGDWRRNAISDKWILISPEALNTQGTNRITNDSHEEIWRGF